MRPGTIRVRIGVAHAGGHDRLSSIANRRWAGPIRHEPRLTPIRGFKFVQISKATLPAISARLPPVAMGRRGTPAVRLRAGNLLTPTQPSVSLSMQDQPSGQRRKVSPVRPPSLPNAIDQFLRPDQLNCVTSPTAGSRCGDLRDGPDGVPRIRALGRLFPNTGAFKHDIESRDFAAISGLVTFQFSPARASGNSIAER